MVDKVTKRVKLDLSEINPAQRRSAKEEVGEFLRQEILRSVSRGSSPVSGEGAFKRLSKDYADEFKGGNRSPNLQLFGDMLDSLESKNTRDGIEIGIFKKSEVPKADGHNNFSGDSKLPKRRFIPESNQVFKRDIQRGVEDILSSYKSSSREQRVLDEIIARPTLFADSEQVEITIDDIFLNSIFQDILDENG